MLSVSPFVYSFLSSFFFHVPSVSPHSISCSLFHSWGLSFFHPLLCFSLASFFYQVPRCWERQLCFVSKLCLVETTAPSICCWQKFNNHPPSIGIHVCLSLLPSLCYLILWNKMKDNLESIWGRKGLTIYPAPLPAGSLITTNYWTVHQCTRKKRKNKKKVLCVFAGAC